MNKTRKPSLSLFQIWNMSFGFLGIQYGFGLQQANLSPIFRYHGASESELPILWLAGPITGLLIQPLVGAYSDRTWTRWGRRKPFFLFGALLGSLAVMMMPYVPYLWMVVGLFWILDASMNTAMEPYRALIGDKLNESQHRVGFSMQAFMVAGGQILAGLMPLILLGFGVSAETDGTSIPQIVKISFVIGVIAMLITMTWTALTTQEYPPEDLEAFEREHAGKNALTETVREIWTAVSEMPLVLRRIWWVKLFTWFGLPLMWQYLGLSIARHCFNAPTPQSPGFAEGTANAGLALTVMNITTVVMSLMMPAIVHRMGARATYAVCLSSAGAGFVGMLLADTVPEVLTCMVFVGIGWASIITVPFIMTAAAVPSSRNGVYMGLLNAFICLPQILCMLSIGFVYDSLLAGDPRNALVLCGICMWLGAIATLRIPQQPNTDSTSEDVFEAEATARTMTER